jgi:hypothetical protein
VALRSPARSSAVARSAWAQGLPVMGGRALGVADGQQGGSVPAVLAGRAEAELSADLVVHLVGGRSGLAGAAVPVAGHRLQALLGRGREAAQIKRGGGHQAADLPGQQVQVSGLLWSPGAFDHPVDQCPDLTSPLVGQQRRRQRVGAGQPDELFPQPVDGLGVQSRRTGLAACSADSCAEVIRTLQSAALSLIGPAPATAVGAVIRPSAPRSGSGPANRTSGSTRVPALGGSGFSGP